MSNQSRGFHLPLKNITATFNTSKMGYTDHTGVTNSPMSNLAFNLSELSTGRNPSRRKLSLTMVDASSSHGTRSESESSLSECDDILWSPTEDSQILGSDGHLLTSSLGFHDEEHETFKFGIENDGSDHASKQYLYDACSQDSGLGIEQDRRSSVPSFDDAASVSSSSSSLSHLDRLPSLDDVWSTLDSPSFKTPKGMPPKRSRSLVDKHFNEDTCSPLKYSPIKSSSLPRPSFSQALFASQIPESKDESSEIQSPVLNDGFRELFKLDNGCTTVGRRKLQRSQSVDYRPRPSCKRCDPPSENTDPVLNKKWRGETEATTNQSDDDDDVCDNMMLGARRLHRCHSETEAMIKSAISQMFSDPDLLGDCSKAYCLPTVSGRHQDLKSISPETLSQLMADAFSDVVEEYQIIDCRYPYEFEGGHIQNAVNIYTKEEVVNMFMKSPQRVKDPNKRKILVFHCEFSSERGPGLCRFLRRQDRETNKECYPFLHYPEMYLLEGGYKHFFEHYSNLCEPRKYKPMLDKNHLDDLRKCRAKCKSWADERSHFRTGVRNLRF
ncbi:hypothetical protein BsWGS_04329 [Bradybaena similaris]